MKQRILVVDDDEMVLKLTVMIVTRRLGYDAAEARSGEEALRIWDGHFDLLLTDTCSPADTLAKWLIAARCPKVSGLSTSPTSPKTLKRSSASYLVLVKNRRVFRDPVKRGLRRGIRNLREVLPGPSATYLAFGDYGKVAVTCQNPFSVVDCRAMVGS